MRLAIDIAAWFTFALLALGLLAFVVTSLQERRVRPAWRAGVLTALFVVALTPLLVFDYSGKLVVEAVFVGGFVVAVILLLAPFGDRPRLQLPGPPAQIDERDAVFHRFLRLQPGTADYETYYIAHPEKRKLDEHIRTLPRLGEPGSRSYDPLTSKYMRATFDVLDELTGDLDDAAAPPADRCPGRRCLTGGIDPANQGICPLSRGGGCRRYRAQSGPRVQPHRPLPRDLGRAD